MQRAACHSNSAAKVNPLTVMKDFYGCIESSEGREGRKKMNQTVISRLKTENNIYEQSITTNGVWSHFQLHLLVESSGLPIAGWTATQTHSCLCPLSFSTLQCNVISFKVWLWITSLFPVLSLLGQWSISYCIVYYSIGSHFIDHIFSYCIVTYCSYSIVSYPTYRIVLSISFSFVTYSNLSYHIVS